MINIRAVTVLWGADFVEMFLRVGLRSLLAPGNLPDLAQRHRVTYTIYTTPEDGRAIESDPAFRRLKETVDARLSLFSPGEIDASYSGSHHTLWDRGFELARRNREILFLLIPDLVFAEDTLVRWARRFEEGYRAVFTPGPQVVLESVLPELEARTANSRDPLRVSREDLEQTVLRHIHPLHAAMLRDSPRRVAHPEYDIRAVKGRGFILREWTANPFCVDPSHFLSISLTSPTDHLDDIAVEPCSVMSVEPLFKLHRWYYRPWQLSGTRICQLGQWWNLFGVAGCLRYSSVFHDFAISKDSDWDKGRREALAAGRFLRYQLFAARQIYRVISAIRNAKQYRAAAILASAVYGARLRRSVALPADSTLLVPVDAAFGLPEQEHIAQLLQPGSENRLRAFLLDHVVTSANHRDKADLVTARGLPLVDIAEDVQVISGPTFVDGLRVLFIDRVLSRDIQFAHARRTSSKAHISDASAACEAPAVAHRTEGNEREFAGASGDRAAVDARAEAPARPTVVQAASQAVLRAAFRPVKASLRIAFYVASPLPLIGRLARLARDVYIVWRVKGARAATVRVQNGIAFRAKRLLRALYAAIEPVPLAGRGARISRRMYVIWRTEGSRALGKRVTRRLFLSLSFVTGSPVPAASLATLREVRTARTLQGMEQILGAYADATALPSGKIASLELVKERLAANKLAGERGFTALEATLRRLLQRHPSWAECWLELGFLYQDLGHNERAIEAFGRAGESKVLCDSAWECRDARAAALLERARILSLCGDLQRAATDYGASLAIDPHQSIARIEYGNLLRTLGRADDSVQYFAGATDYEESKWCVPKVGRNARRLAFNSIVVDAPASELERRDAMA